MQAIVKQINDGKIAVRVRRNYRNEILDLSHNEILANNFQIGDKLEVRRQANNPYLVFVKKVLN